jgi:hypothetical protein
MAFYNIADRATQIVHVNVKSGYGGGAKTADLYICRAVPLVISRSPNSTKVTGAVAFPPWIICISYFCGYITKHACWFVGLYLKILSTLSLNLQQHSF